MMHDDQIACGYMTSLQDRYIKSDLNSEKIGKEAPIWGVAQFGEMSNPGSKTRVESHQSQPKK